MHLITKDDYKRERMNVLGEILKGAVFIYPTDTLYVIGCDARNTKAVERIRKAKPNFDRPFWVIPPNKEWIAQHCEASEAKELLEQLPGQMTLVLPLKNEKAIAKEVNHGNGTIGIKMPLHWIMREIKELGIPIVATTANTLDGDFVCSHEDVEHELSRHVDFFIYDGEIKGKPTKVINLAEALLKH